MTTAVPERRVLVSADDAVYWLWTAHRVKVSPVTIRQWAFRRHIGIHRPGRAPYDLREVEKRALKARRIAE